MVRVARALLVSQVALMGEYRAEIALWALSGLLPFIMLALWRQAPAGAALGLGPEGLDRYFLSAFLVRQFSVVWVVFAFEEDALLGRLSPYLLQPLHPLWRYLAAHLAEQLTRLPFAAAIAATQGGQCMDNSYADYLLQLRNTTADRGARGLGLRQWTWQCCTQFSYWQDCDKDSQCPLSKAFMTLDSNTQQCQDAFGVLPSGHLQGRSRSV
jgi:hypothetical protein